MTGATPGDGEEQNKARYIRRLYTHYILVLPIYTLHIGITYIHITDWYYLYTHYILVLPIYTLQIGITYIHITYWYYLYTHYRLVLLDYKDWPILDSYIYTYTYLCSLGLSRGVLVAVQSR